MKKIILKSVSLVLAISLLSAQSFTVYAADASSAAIELDESAFSFDEELILSELSELNELDAYLEANASVTYETLANEASNLIANIESSAAPMGMADQEGEPPLGIPSFLWGCVGGVVGLLIVYIMTDNDKEETKKALWGCVASTAVVTVVYLVAWGAWATTATAYSYY